MNLDGTLDHIDRAAQNEAIRIVATHPLYEGFPTPYFVELLELLASTYIQARKDAPDMAGFHAAVVRLGQWKWSENDGWEEMYD
jgi:hypothetical protein